MLRRIDDLSYRNALRAVPPLWKSLFTAVMLVLSYTLHPALQLVICGWMMHWCLRHAGIPLRAYGMLFGTALLFYALSLPALLVELGQPGNAGTAMGLPLTGGLQLYVTAEGVSRAGLLLARVMACLSCFLFLMLTTPFMELLQVLRRLRLPQLVLELMLVTYRFLFLLSDTAHGLLLARRLRGGGRRITLKETAGLGSALLAGAMRRYRGLAQGMTVRGYTGEIALPPAEQRKLPSGLAARAAAGIAVLLVAQLWLLPALASEGFRSCGL
ncbi:cobalt ECF transporter T component CbiQ ['Paenibacillus yunnanensis' Narsing Rao et al. 2020]|uniref:cobalt ECF transporter T component CbiQ n=1 Tax=Paenibacillus tengchongensis TaxID=2608684 RepID=UPI0016520708|nr:cobalt ECF transporter T component CbiQ [Paenibacillus tengchongensis]